MFWLNKSSCESSPRHFGYTTPKKKIATKKVFLKKKKKKKKKKETLGLGGSKEVTG
jgi:hypothetical protein